MHMHYKSPRLKMLSQYRKIKTEKLRNTNMLDKCRNVTLAKKQRELVVESQYLLKLQSGKITKKPVLSQLNALVRCDVVTRRVFESPKCDKCVWRPGSAGHAGGALALPKNP